MLSKQAVPLLVVLVVAACSSGGFVDTEARVEVDAAAQLGRVYLGEIGEGGFQVRSTGSSWVELLSVESADPALVVDLGGVAKVAPGALLKVRLAWTPAAAGRLDTTVTVRTEVEGAEPFTVRVTGEARAAPDCDDANACTDDRFERNGERCLHANHDRACEDGSACTVEDRCQDGACRGRARSCKDDDVCTLDLCDPASGCLFPPDNRTCDDGDPCTEDVCDKDDGCGHPDADDGTACGAFSCALAHVCVFGSCRALDVTGVSDDFPCFDGDLCTRDDACQDGACVGGPLVQSAPSLVATIETFGGAGVGMATDGLRYLFGDSTALHLAVLEPNGNELRLVGTLPLIAETAPVMLAPGRFAVAAGGIIQLVDATDVLHPTVTPLWDLARVLSAPAQIVRHLALAGGGLIFTSIDAEGLFTRHAGFLPQQGPTMRLPVLDGYERLADAQDVDADGVNVVFADAGMANWFTIDPSGKPGDLNPFLAYAAPFASAVSVRGDRIALLSGNGVTIWELALSQAAPLACASEPCAILGPGCDGTFPFSEGRYRLCAPTSQGCPVGSTCEMVRANTCLNCDNLDCEDSCCNDESVAVCMRPGYAHSALGEIFPLTGGFDVVLTDDLVYWSSAAGIDAAVVRSPNAPFNTLTTRISTLPARWLGRGPDHLLASGDVALPLRVQPTFATGPPVAPPLVPPHMLITGVGHGSVSAVTDADAPKVLVGGKSSIGEVDLLNKRFVNWKFFETQATSERPRLLKGKTRTVALNGWSRDDGSTAQQPCPGVPIGVADASGREATLAPCGLFSSLFEPVGHRLYAVTDHGASDSALVATPPVLRAWSLDPFDPQPLFTIPASSQLDVTLEDFRLRASDANSSEVAVTTTAYPPDASMLTVEVFDSSVPPASLGQLQIEKLSHPPRTRNLIATESRHALLGTKAGVMGSPAECGIGLFELAARTEPPDPLAPFTPVRARHELQQCSRHAPTIPWMANGRAWAEWTRENPVTGETQPVLTELAYDVQSAALGSPGEVLLPAIATSVRDTGVYTVATSAAGVHIIAPACR